jgi:hypothetical protein
MLVETKIGKRGNVIGRVIAANSSCGKIVLFPSTNMPEAAKTVLIKDYLEEETVIRVTEWTAWAPLKPGDPLQIYFGG